MKVLLDTNIILDYALERKPYANSDLRSHHTNYSGFLRFNCLLRSLGWSIILVMRS
ncbi:MAG: hypothetical protein AAGA60_26400 [Cyanobacteria bacterium P01_E01_bin.42]